MSQPAPVDIHRQKAPQGLKRVPKGPQGDPKSPKRAEEETKNTVPEVIEEHSAEEIKQDWMDDLQIGLTFLSMKPSKLECPGMNL